MGKARSAGSEVADRKNELKKWEKEYPHRKMAWIGGILHFTDTGGRPQEVPGAKKIPKQGSVARGLAGAFPSASQGRFRPGPPQKDKGINYWDLPWAKDRDGECCNCGNYPNPKETIYTDDCGHSTVIKCRRCGALMRPSY
ncbi:MAG: hypothetical protein PHZ04_05240 [Patescibacteria group bacterium]|nr:hypothetical protein [Patescibacteria group bacterium]MDD5554556.1 hypothetical protein [Patescibacteria group bacterium]